MTSRDFCFWLQGFLEIQAASNDRPFAPGEQEPGPITLTAGQLRCVQRHLELVFKHEIDPSAGPQKVQDALNKIHHPGNGGLHEPPLMRC